MYLKSPADCSVENPIEVSSCGFGEICLDLLYYNSPHKDDGRLNYVAAKELERSG